MEKFNEEEREIKKKVYGEMYVDALRRHILAYNYNIETLSEDMDESILEELDNMIVKEVEDLAPDLVIKRFNGLQFIVCKRDEYLHIIEGQDDET